MMMQFTEPQQPDENRERLKSLLIERAAPQPARLAASSKVVPFNDSGTRIPLYCVLGGGAGMKEYHRLSALLSDDQPVFGLQTVGATVDDPVIHSIDRLADLHFQKLRNFQSTGPVNLCGHSMGAVVALELAQQLVRSGRQVETLIVIDQPGPDVKLSTWDWLYWQWVAVSHLPIGQRGKYVLDGVRYRLATNQRMPAVLRRLFHFRRSGKSVRQKGPKSAAEYRRLMTDISIEALKRYRPQPYNQPMVLFRAQSSAPRLHADAFGGWKNISGGKIKVHEIPGHHMNIFESPNIDQFASLLENCLE